MPDKIVNHFVLADGSTAKYDAGALLNLDDTVSLAGYAPDAKAVGDKLTAIEETANHADELAETLNEGGLELKDVVITGQIDTWLDEHPEATTTVQDGAITKAKINTAFLPEIENAYVTPEMFGAVGDGTTDDTAALQTMFNTRAKYYILNKTYKITNLSIYNISNALVKCGKIVCDSHDNQHFLITVRQCNNTVFDGLTITSTNDKDAFVPSGFSQQAGAKSSNVIGLRIEKCRDLVFNNLTEENLLYNIWLAKAESDEYDDDGNKNIRFNNLTITGAQEGLHSNESHGVYINGLKFRTAEICAHGYHAFYFELNSTYLYINNFDIDVASTYYSVFDFADHNAWNDNFYNLAVDIENGFCYAFTHFQFNWRNKYCAVKNCTFKTKPWTASGSTETVARFVDVGDSDAAAGKYPTITFDNCDFIADENITVNYLTRSEKYAKYNFYNSRTNFRINTSLGDVSMWNCVITGLLVYIFGSKNGNVKLYGCTWNLTDLTSYTLACRTVDFAIYLYNCIVNLGANTQFINNNDQASNINIYNTIFTAGSNVAYFQVDNGAGVTKLNSYWNNTLIN